MKAGGESLASPPAWPASAFRCLNARPAAFCPGRLRCRHAAHAL